MGLQTIASRPHPQSRFLELRRREVADRAGSTRCRSRSPRAPRGRNAVVGGKSDGTKIAEPVAMVMAENSHLPPGLDRRMSLPTNNPPTMASIPQCRPDSLNGFLPMDVTFINQ